MGGGEPRPKLPNIEFSYIKQLQQDNSELRTLLEEHQAALDMIMSKYRQQVREGAKCFVCAGLMTEYFVVNVRRLVHS